MRRSGNPISGDNDSTFWSVPLLLALLPTLFHTTPIRKQRARGCYSSSLPQKESERERERELCFSSKPLGRTARKIDYHHQRVHCLSPLSPYLLPETRQVGHDFRAICEREVGLKNVLPPPYWPICEEGKWLSLSRESPPPLSPVWSGKLCPLSSSSSWRIEGVILPTSLSAASTVLLQYKDVWEKIG